MKKEYKKDEIYEKENIIPEYDYNYIFDMESSFGFKLLKVKKIKWKYRCIMKNYNIIDLDETFKKWMKSSNKLFKI